MIGAILAVGTLLGLSAILKRVVNDPSYAFSGRYLSLFSKRERIFRLIPALYYPNPVICTKQAKKVFSKDYKHMIVIP